jgi:hypothetical protein
MRLGLDGLRALGETFICEAGLIVQGYVGWRISQRKLAY